MQKLSPSVGSEGKLNSHLRIVFGAMAYDIRREADAKRVRRSEVEREGVDRTIRDRGELVGNKVEL